MMLDSAGLLLTVFGFTGKLAFQRSPFVNALAEAAHCWVLCATAASSHMMMMWCLRSRKEGQELETRGERGRCNYAVAGEPW